MLSSSSLSIGGIARAKAIALARELGVQQLVPALLRFLRTVGEDWFERQADWPLFDTDITDDGSPFELSLALEGDQAELRVLAEAQQAPYDLDSNWRAGVRTTQQLAHEHDLDLSRFHRVVELFRPIPGPARFAIWHAAAFSDGKAPLYKIYFNPSARGCGTEEATVEEALLRLRMRESWSFLSRKLAQAPGARLAFFSLDLHAGTDARLKVYVAFPDATADVIEAGLTGSSDFRPGEAASFIRQVTGRAGPFSARPLLACYAFCAGRPAPNVTLHVPVRCYLADDARVLEACGGLLGARADTLGRALRAMAGRPLSGQGGLLTYASLRCHSRDSRLTLYLSPQLYTQQTGVHASDTPLRSSMVAPRAAGLGASPFAPTMLTVQDAIQRARLLLRQHPFIQRLERGADLGQLRSMTRALTFFVMCFQDVLRLARMTISDPTLRTISETHELEDRGHEQWFLHDAQRLDSACDLRTVFSSEHDAVRDVSYGLIAEVLGADDDRQRLAVVLCLEAAGAEFFHRVIAQLERLGAADGLRYFARSHQAVEENHEVFENDTQLTLASIPAPQDVLPAVLRSVERSFVAIARLADEMERVMRSSEPTRSVA
jgi:DMATS type aromatic prenyltransferase